MRVLSKAKRHRIALAYAIAAWVTLIGAVWMGALAEGSALAWVLPILGLSGYTLCASLAMLLWQGRRTKPRPPRARPSRRGQGPRVVGSRSGDRSWPAA